MTQQNRVISKKQDKGMAAQSVFKRLVFVLIMMIHKVLNTPGRMCLYLRVQLPENYRQREKNVLQKLAKPFSIDV